MLVDLFFLMSCSYDATLTATGLNLKVKLHTKDLRLPLRNKNREWHCFQVERLMFNGNCTLQKVEEPHWWRRQRGWRRRVIDTEVRQGVNGWRVCFLSPPDLETAQTRILSTSLTLPFDLTEIGVSRSIWDSLLLWKVARLLVSTSFFLLPENIQSII